MRTASFKHDREARRRTMVGAVGALCALGMLVGALGPWARTPLLTVTGWSGLGFPFAIISLLVLCLQVAYVFDPRRAWLAISAVLGLLTATSAALLALGINTLSEFGDVVNSVFELGGYDDVLGSQKALTVAWGLVLLGVTATLLTLASVVGLLAGTHASHGDGSDSRDVVVREEAPQLEPGELDPRWLEPQ